VVELCKRSVTVPFYTPNITSLNPSHFWMLYWVFAGRSRLGFFFYWFPASALTITHKYRIRKEDFLSCIKKLT